MVHPVKFVVNDPFVTAVLTDALVTRASLIQIRILLSVSSINAVSVIENMKGKNLAAALDNVCPIY
jgi:hypothetical protein